MQKIKRLRPRMLRLWLPNLVLAACSATWAFYAGRELDPQFAIELYVGLSITLFLLWVLPTLSYLGSFIDLYDTKLVVRKGIFGPKRVLEFSETKDFGDVIKGYPSRKALAAELSALAK